MAPPTRVAPAIDEVLADEPVDVGPEPTLIEVGAGLAEADEGVGDALRYRRLRSRTAAGSGVRRWSVRSSPTRPKSRKMICPVSGSTRTLPGCGSPWKKPSMRTCLISARMKTEPRWLVSASGGLEPVDVGDLDAPDELGGQDPRPERSVSTTGMWISGNFCHRLRDPLGVVRLVAVVELLDDALRELADDGPGAELAGQVEALLGDLAELLEHAQVGLGLGEDARALDLDRDEPAVGQRGPVDLGGRGGGERLGARSSRTAPRRGCPNSSTRIASASSQRNGATSLWSFSSSSSERRRQGLAAARDHLADLHVGRAELLEHQPDPRLGRSCSSGTSRPRTRRWNQRSDPTQRRPLEGDVEAVAIDRVVDLLEADVLDDPVPPWRRQGVEEPPDRPWPPPSVGRRSGR